MTTSRPMSTTSRISSVRSRRNGSYERRASLLVRRGEDLQTADLSEADLRADRRGGATVPLDDRGGATVGARVREAARDERRIQAVTAVVLECRRTAKQNGGRTGEIHKPSPCDDRVITERRDIRARFDAISR